MSEMHFREPWFGYSASGPFTKNKRRMEGFNWKGDSRPIYQNKLDKASF